MWHVAKNYRPNGLIIDPLYDILNTHTITDEN